MEKVLKGFNDFKPDAVMHLAAESHVDKSIESGADFMHTNVNGTYHLLEVVREYVTLNQLQDKFKFQHVSCYDEETRAFTKSGLKKYSELIVGDEVLSINPETKNAEWKPITKIIVQDYCGNMVHFKNNKSDILVTPNHRMYFKKGSEVGITEAENFLKGFEDIVYFPEVKHQGKSVDTIHVDGVGDMCATDLMYLIGVYLGDGGKDHQIKKSLSKSGLSKKQRMAVRNESGQFLASEPTTATVFTEMNAYRIFLNVPVTKKGRVRLEQVLNNLSIKWSTHHNGNIIYFGGKQWYDFFDKFQTGAVNKQIPSEILEYDLELLNSLFDGLMDTDGSYIKGLPKVYSTSSENLRNGVIELLVKLGKHPRFSERLTDMTMTCGRHIKSDIPNFMVYIRNNSIKLGIDCSHVPYEGKVWCVAVQGNKNLLVERNGIFIFSGNTDEVYGSLGFDDEPFTEKSQYQPNSPYSASKAASDHLVRAAFKTYNIKTVTTHCSNNYGPQQLPEKLIPNTINKAFERRKIPVYGKGDNIRDWIHVDDHCDALLTVLKKGVPGESYSIGSDNEWNNLSLVIKICDLIDSILVGKEKKNELARNNLIEFVTDRKGHDVRYAIDSSKIRNELGWKPKVDFEEGLKETIIWYLNHQDWWA
jgi:dTDP-glucose 4,6-dehydratase